MGEPNFQGIKSGKGIGSIWRAGLRESWKRRMQVPDLGHEAAPSGGLADLRPAGKKRRRSSGMALVARFGQCLQVWVGKPVEPITQCT